MSGLSLNEVSATARKAARGAGFDWGLADEAGMATRWLCARGLDGCAALHAALGAVEANGLAACRPVPGVETWDAAEGGTLCPIHAGAAISDHALLLEPVAPAITLRQVVQPVLVLPFAAQIARRLGRAVSVTVSEHAFRVSDGALDPARAPDVDCGDLVLRFESTAPRAAPARTRATPAPQAWQGLMALAHRTYAPATEASRRAGAGGDLPDTD